MWRRLGGTQYLTALLKPVLQRIRSDLIYTASEVRSALYPLYPERSRPSRVPHSSLPPGCG